MTPMINPLLAIGGVGVILLISEISWKVSHIKKPEIYRKFVHILTGVYISLWPLFLSLAWIQALSILMFLVVLASKRFNIFGSIHEVTRTTYGEIMFPLGVLVAATFAQSGWVYMAAVLHLSLADGLAALIGVRFMKNFSYKVFGHTKTIIGSATFFVVSMFIVAGVMLLDPLPYGQNAQFAIIIVPLLTTIIENFASYGTDNLFVPLAVIFILDSMRIVA